MYIVYIRKRYYVSLVCKIKKLMRNVEVKIDRYTQRGGLGFRERIDNRCVIFIHLMFSSIVVV